MLLNSCLTLHAAKLASPIEVHANDLKVYDFRGEDKLTSWLKRNTGSEEHLRVLAVKFIQVEYLEYQGIQETDHLISKEGIPEEQLEPVKQPMEMAKEGLEDVTHGGLGEVAEEEPKWSRFTRDSPGRATRGSPGRTRGTEAV